jgi:hypothetical protein
VDHIQVEGFAGGARFFGAIEDGDRPHGFRQRLDKGLGVKGAIEAHLQHPYLFPGLVQGVHRFMGGLCPGAHQHQHPLSGGVPDIVKNAIVATRQRAKLIHGLLH